jgi:hypothetical protein
MEFPSRKICPAIFDQLLFTFGTAQSRKSVSRYEFIPSGLRAASIIASGCNQSARTVSIARSRILGLSRLGFGSWLAGFDFVNRFRLTPVRRWSGRIFGADLLPKVCNRLAQRSADFGDSPGSEQQ